ncbi:MAG: serine/threonine-protein kinase [bacterium]
MAELQPGTLIEKRYRIERKLGAGGFATVYAAHHEGLDRPAALKVLDIHSHAVDDAFLQRFHREAKVAAQLEHPNVVRIFDFGELDDGAPYIAMERLSGHDLEQEIKLNGAMNVDRMSRLFVPVLDALAGAHARGVVHKDLKPSNLFILQPGTIDERMVVLDFGIARVMDARTQYTQAGTFAGTPAYLAPEYIKDQSVTPTVDVYQMGLIIIEALIGRPVVSANSAVAYLMKHVQGEHDVPSELRTSKLGEILVRAIAVEPTQRFANAGELRDALMAWSASRSTPTVQPTLLGTPELITPAQIATAKRTVAPPPARKKSSSGATLFLIVLFAGFLMFMGLFMLILIAGLAQ